MKSTAVVFEDVRQVGLREIELPPATEQDLVVETLVSGISVGTERWALIGNRGEMKFPHVPGYLSVGRVLQAGRAARERGYREEHLVNFGSSRLPAPYGSNSWMGAHLSHAVLDVCTGADPAPEDENYYRCQILPEGLDPIGASLAGLCAVAMRGIEMATVPAGSTVLIVGIGVIGQFASQVCRLKGARVAVADVDSPRLSVAQKTGVEWSINCKTENLAERAAVIAPRGFDIIIDTSSNPQVVNSLFPLLKVHGKFVFQGWYPPPSSLDLNAFHVRVPTCYFPCGYSEWAVACALRWIHEGKLDACSLISHRATVGGAAKVYDMILNGTPAFLGVIFDWRLK